LPPSPAARNASDLSTLFKQDGRDNVKVADLTRGLEDQRSQTPKIQGRKIDNVDFGDKFKSTKDGNKYNRKHPSVQRLRIHVDGKWINAHDYLVSLELEDKDASSSDPTDMALELVDGKLFASDCDDLQSFTKADSPPTANAARRHAHPSAYYQLDAYALGYQHSYLRQHQRWRALRR